MNPSPKFAFVGNSHIAYWPLEAYFPEWECLNYGRPGEGIDYVESFGEDVSACEVVVQFGSNDLYGLNVDNMEEYTERYVRAVEAITAIKTYLFPILPRNDYCGDSTAVNRFIAILNEVIKQKIMKANVVYLDVFGRFLLNGRLNQALTIDDLHLNAAGYRLLADELIKNEDKK